MSAAALMLAELPITAPTTKVPGLWASDLFLIFAAALLLCGTIAAWVFFTKRPRSSGGSPARKVYKGISPANAEAGGDESGSGKRRKRRKSRRREHRGRNPTLSETGGLPPPRGPEAPLIP